MPRTPGPPSCRRPSGRRPTAAGRQTRKNDPASARLSADILHPHAQLASPGSAPGKVSGRPDGCAGRVVGRHRRSVQDQAAPRRPGVRGAQRHHVWWPERPPTARKTGDEYDQPVELRHQNQVRRRATTSSSAISGRRRTCSATARRTGGERISRGRRSRCRRWPRAPDDGDPGGA